MQNHLSFSIKLLLLGACAWPICAQIEQTPAEPGLAIVDAGVQSAEDAPFITPSYRFLPGDPIYCTFQITGFKVRARGSSDEPVRSISLSYSVSILDLKNVNLAPAVTDQITVDLSPEDKNWSPKRRATFQLPAVIPSGEYVLRISVRDQVSHLEATKDFTFRIGGVVVPPSAGLSVASFQFFRNQNDREPLDIPAYAPGDTVFVRFLIIGFQLTDENRYRLSYTLKVTSPGGKPFVHAASDELQDKSFYPAAYVQSDLTVTTQKNSAKGQYSVLLTVRDLVSGKTEQYKTSFSIE